MPPHTTTNPNATKKQILKTLLDTIKQCQIKFGSRTELATEQDANVKSLCHAFEVLLHHGGVKEGSSSFWSISSAEKPFTIWPLLQKRILSKNEESRFQLLKNVKTDLGRVRAWLRSSLNEHSLQKYILMLNSENLEEYFEEWAFLRDGELVNLLPEAAGGLGSILFALNIDWVELDEGDDGKKDDPVAQSIPEIGQIAEILNNVKKKKKKPPTSFIHFDEDVKDTISICSNVSERIVLNSEDVQHLRLMGSEGVLEDLIPVPSYDRSSDVEEECTRVEQSSAEPSNPTSANPDSPQMTKLKTILSNEMDNRLKEELNNCNTRHVDHVKILEAKIEFLTKENEVIKAQLHKYVQAVSLLSENEAQVKSVSEELLDYERKLIQVAEMHGELMEFNAYLQSELKKREIIVVGLKEELTSIRGPVNTLNEKILINIWIPSVFLTGPGKGDLHHVYQVFVRIRDTEWNVYRRYSQFYALDKELKKKDSTLNSFCFPPKKLQGNKDAKFVEDRRRKLQEYLRKLLNYIIDRNEVLALHPDKNLLVNLVPFFGEQYKGSTSGKKTRSSSSNESYLENPYTGL